LLALLPESWTKRSHLRVVGQSNEEKSDAVATKSPEPRRRTTPRRRARGGAGTLISAGLIDDIDPNRSLRGSKWYGEVGKIGIAGQMMRDAHVRRSVDSLCDILVNARWSFAPGAKTKLGREVADFLNMAVIESLPWTDYVRRITRGYMVYGCHFEEVTDDFAPIDAGRFPNHLAPEMALLPTGFHHRPTRSISRWWQSKRSPEQLAAVEQYLQGGDREKPGFLTIPGNRLLRWTYDQEGADFEGLALLRSAYGPWKVKLALIGIDAIKHERYGVPTPIGTFPEGTADPDIDAFEEALENLRSLAKGYIALEEGYKAEPFDGGEAKSTNLGAAIHSKNVDIAFNTGTAFMLLGQGGGTGSYALGSTQEGALNNAAEAQSSFFSNRINFGFDGWSLVKRIVHANYGLSAPIPRLRAKNLPTRPWIETMQAFSKGAVAGVMTPDAQTEDDFRDAMGVDPHDPTTARKRPSNMGTPPASGSAEEEQTNDDQ